MQSPKLNPVIMLVEVSFVVLSDFSDSAVTFISEENAGHIQPG